MYHLIKPGDTVRVKFEGIGGMYYNRLGIATRGHSYRSAGGENRYEWNVAFSVFAASPYWFDEEDLELANAVSSSR